MNKKHVTIYTDGACSGNPGPGGWGAVLMYNKSIKELSGYFSHTTNNEMELFAAVSALEALNTACDVSLYSDSAYLVNAFVQRWIDKWKTNDYINSQKKLVANRGLWERLDKLSQCHNISWHKVKGHSDNKYNNRCDELATGEILKNKI